MYIKSMFTARKLEKRKEKLIREKEIAWQHDQGKKVELKISQKYRRCCVGLSRGFRKLCGLPKNSNAYRFCFNIRHEGTCENFTAKSVAGFVGGFFLTYIFFMFFVLQLNFKLSTATIMCSIFGSILTIGLAFSYKVRCIVFLVLPQFFSKKGRQALLAYAYILAITGPAKNTLNNISILGESLACGQEQLKVAVNQIVDAVKKPFYAIRDAIKSVVKSVKEIVNKIKEILLTIKRIIMSLVKVITAGYNFLASTINMCNKEVGTPFERCKRVFENAIVDCNAKLGPLFNWLCNITYLVQNVCYVVKVLDFICLIIDFVKDTVSSVVTRVKQFVRHIRVMFYVRIKFSHSYHFESNRSRTISDITTGIVTEMKQRSSGLIKIFDFMSSAACLFFICMVVKVTYYRYKFLTSERFDNVFITKDFRQIDMRRAQLGLETVLPLNHREHRRYITTNSLKLVQSEKIKMLKSAMIILMASIKLLIHMATDYSLYWIMTMIRHYGRFQSKLRAPNVPELHIDGEGFLADLLRSIVQAFKPIGISVEIDSIPCLPDPIPPDYDRYIQIGSLLILCWFLSIFEAYGLRFRHSVMCYYHPQRARERAIWLYNNIMRSRSSFLKFARRQLRRKMKGDTKIGKVTCREYLGSKLRCKIFQRLLRLKKQTACLLCGEVFRDGDQKQPIKCQTPGCLGIYCEKCFSDLQNLCTVCLDPIQYGDLSDVSEEKDSSEEGNPKDVKKKEKKKKKKRRKSYCTNKSSDTDDDDRKDDDDKKKLLPKKKKQDADSDYYSSTVNDSSDYSYSYQDKKDITQITSSTPTRTLFVDVEKQNIPEEASMEEFRREFEIQSDTEININTSSSLITELDRDYKKTQTILTSLEHLGVVENRSSKLSVLLSTSKTFEDSATSTPTRTPFDTYSSSPKDTNWLLEEQLLRKTNSKISTESIPMEAIPTDTTLNDSNSSQKLDTTTSVTTFILTPQAKVASSVCVLQERSKNVSHAFSQTSVVAVDDAQESSIHPDVPQLDLDFLDKDDENVCHHQSTEESKSPCNCRLFKSSVKYDLISETKRGSSSSRITEIQSSRRLITVDQEIVSANVDAENEPVIESPQIPTIMGQESDIQSLQIQENVEIIAPQTVDKEITSDPKILSPVQEMFVAETSPATPTSSNRRQSIGRFSDTSSSLISSLARLPKKSDQFSLSPATKALSVDVNYPTIKEVEETDEFRSVTTESPPPILNRTISKYKNYPKRIFTSSDNTSSDESTASYLIDTNPSSHTSRELSVTNYDDFDERKVLGILQKIPSGSGSGLIAGLQNVPELQLCRRDRDAGLQNESQSQLRRRPIKELTYDERNPLCRQNVRDYYRRLKMDQFQKIHDPPKKQKESTMKKILKIFKGKKKRTVL